LTGYETLRTPFTRLTNKTITNQFGSIVLDLVRRDVLMVPSAMSLVGRRPLPLPTIDHYQCYRTKQATGSRVQQDQREVQDQLETVSDTLVRRTASASRQQERRRPDGADPSGPAALLQSKGGRASGRSKCRSTTSSEATAAH